jgi:formate dehydrogenase subunit delta
MKIERLVEMANQIGDFFGAEPDPKEAAAGAASHLRRFWDPRMRRQIIEHYQRAGGTGLSAVARAAVGLLAGQAEAATPSAATKS